MADAAVLTPRQRQTLNGRRTLAARFASPEEKSAHYRRLAQASNAHRVIVTPDEAEALGAAYRLLGNIVARVEAKRQQETEAEHASV